MRIYNTDDAMKKLWIAMLGDYRNVFGSDYGSRHLEQLRDGGIKCFRNLPWPGRARVSPYLHKVEYQLECLFKRYRFKDDVFSDQELHQQAVEKFMATQMRLSQPLEITPVIMRVLQRARAKAREILGEYSEEEHLALCRFGKRACVGTPYRSSYLDCKVQHITGSTRHIEWFRKKLLPSDALLTRVFMEGADFEQRLLMCDTLTLTFVPKSYKALRSIMPDTLVGTFYTSGLGAVLEKRLRSFGLDIRRLQMKHRRLARAYSVTRECATADLSAASDSIKTELLRWILPSKWYARIMLGRIPYVQIGDTRIRMNTVITMGLGHTFPLQTLIFYCLLQAIAELVSAPTHKVSVYGDDLIYPSRMHKYVVHIFGKLQLLLNEDKTYVKDSFRESCGGDYYRGCDVRPYQPEGEHNLLSRRSYGAFLYRIYNGLRRRWEREDLPQTFTWLENELILSQEGGLLQVPPSFPDDAGLKVSRPKTEACYSPVEWDLVKQRWVFQYLHRNSDNRVVQTQLPYYWERLREKDDSDFIQSWDDVADTPVLKWVRARKPPTHIKSGITGKKYRRLLPCVPKKGTAKLVSQTGSTSSWI